MNLNNLVRKFPFEYLGIFAFWCDVFGVSMFFFVFDWIFLLTMEIRQNKKIYCGDLSV